MRVLFVISDLAYHGAQKQVVELSRELARRGHQVAIYTLNDDAPRAAELAGSGVEVIVDQKKVKLDPAVLLRLRRKIRNWRAEIVHGFLFDGDIYARLAAAGTGAAVLNSERSDNYEISRTQKVAHWLTRGLVDGVVANSRSGSAFAQRLYGYRPERMHVVWNGMRIEDFERKGASGVDHRAEFFGQDPVRIACMIGHIKPAKDYPLALDTAAALLSLAPDWRVLFLGDSLGGSGAYQAGRDSDTSDYKRRVMDRYQELGLTPDKVVFAGARSDAPAILAQCDVQLMTSRWEGFPNVVLEGMVLGVPVVSTEYSDIKHILPRSTQIVADRSPEALARAIADAYADREAIAGEQKRWVRAHASIETAARELESVYARYVRAVPHAQAA
ncbi:MAG: glycosyltransferase [Pseudomonadota bacterium]|nr:glycosyltransferase [Pseudomonadota bacterium]